MNIMGIQSENFINIGMISGFNAGSIINCEISGTFSVLSSHDNYNTFHAIGGVTGLNFGTITNCTVSGEIFIQATWIDENGENIDGEARIGGIAGENWEYSEVETSYNIGTIETELKGETEQGNSEQGDIEQGDTEPGDSEQENAEQGDAEPGNIEQESTEQGNTGQGDTDQGGTEPGDIEPGEGEPQLVGSILGSNEGSVSSCYYLDDGTDLLGVGNKASDDPDNTVNTKKLTDEQMKEEENFDGFDFENIWKIDEGEHSYPVLR